MSGKLTELLERVKPSWAQDEEITKAVARRNDSALREIVTDYIVTVNGIRREAATAISTLQGERDAIEAAIYGRHEKGFVMRPLIDPPSLPDAIRDLKAQRELAYDMPQGPASRVLWSDRYSEILGEYKDEYAKRKAAEAALAEAMKALEPFARINNWDTSPDEAVFFEPFGTAKAITVGDIRAARELVARSRMEPGK